MIEEEETYCDEAEDQSTVKTCVLFLSAHCLLKKLPCDKPRIQ